MDMTIARANMPS